MTLTELADRLGCRLDGDGQLDVRRVTGLETAGPGDLTFFANPKYAAALKATRATAVIAADDVEAAPCAVLRTKNPYLAFARAVALFAERWRPAPGVHSTAFVGAGAAVDPEASIGPMAVIDAGARVGARTIIHANVTVGRSAQIGTDCVIHAGVSIRERVQLGDRVILQNGVVIGSDGYGFARDENGRHVKIPQVGGVVIEDDVEIGANSTVDRPAVGETRIKAGTKIDNLVQIAHGVTIGRDVLLAAQVGIAGSTTLEDRVTLGGQVGVAGHLTIGKGAIVSGQTGISTSVDPGGFMSGYPAIPNRDWLKATVMFRRLPELRKTIADLKARVAELEARLGS